jgi:putative mRNA 3-end processing factor
MRAAPPRAENWLKIDEAGLYCAPGDFHIDPARPVARAVISHGHSDHARQGHGAVLATEETLAIMRSRFGDAAFASAEPAAYGAVTRRNGVSVRLIPAGHMLGSAQIALEHRGCRIVVSGDYKRRRDPTCAPFEPVPCDVFVTEATFGLPVFRHPPEAQEIARLLHSVALFPERAHLVGVYSLGKCQRVIMLLREAGWERPIFLHGALQEPCALYERFGIALGELRPAAGASRAALAGEIVLAPPSELGGRWSRRLPEPVPAMASGWMRVRARARQRGVELPLVLSDHADWDELLATAQDVGAPRVWVTHGREEALVHALAARGFDATALHLVGFEEEEGE